MDEMMLMIYKWVMEHTWSQYVITAFMVLKFATQFVPSVIQGKWYYNYPMKFINMFLMNNGKNKNADDKPLVVANAK